MFSHHPHPPHTPQTTLQLELPQSFAARPPRSAYPGRGVIPTRRAAKGANRPQRKSSLPLGLRIVGAAEPLSPPDVEKDELPRKSFVHTAERPLEDVTSSPFTAALSGKAFHSGFARPSPLLGGGGGGGGGGEVSVASPCSFTRTNTTPRGFAPRTPSAMSVVPMSPRSTPMSPAEKETAFFDTLDGLLASTGHTPKMRVCTPRAGGGRGGGGGGGGSRREVVRAGSRGDVSCPTPVSTLEGHAASSEFAVGPLSPTPLRAGEGEGMAFSSFFERLRVGTLFYLFNARARGKF